MVFTTNTPAGDYRLRQPADWEAFAKELHGQSLEAYLRPFDGPLDDLADAARRPGSRLLVNYGDSQDTPTLLNMRAMARVLRLRALARLHAGKPEAAMDDVVTSLRLIEHLQKEPHLLSQLLRLAYAGILLQPVWEGLNAHVWNDTQLARLEAALASIELIGPMQTAWRYERCNSISQLEKRVAGGVDGPYGLLTDPTAPPAPATSRLVRKIFLPRGWVYQNLCAMDEVFEIGVSTVLDPEHHRVHPERTSLAEGRYKSLRLLPFGTPLASPIFPAMVTQDIRVAKAQSFFDQARVATALERFKLGRGHYPENLHDLTPAYLRQVPHDLITGESLKYARTSSAFTLYSVGWNGKDDHGQIAPATSAEHDQERGDWVWAKAK
jgi:hypothetical protein